LHTNRLEKLWSDFIKFLLQVSTCIYFD